MNEIGDNSEDLVSAAEHASHFYMDDANEVLLLSNCKILKPILQNGPECGIVALSMATQLLTDPPIQSSEILNKARQMSFTLQGEMFSANNMSMLAECVCNCKAEVLTNLNDQKFKIVAHVLNGYPVLIPYDADYNHVPSNLKGHKAHWAVVIGVGLIMSKIDFTEEISQRIYIYENSALLEYLDKAASILVYARQGKSKKIAIWELNELLVSNGNLKELAGKHDPTTMILPPDDVLGGLRNKAVLLTPINGAFKFKQEISVEPTQSH